MCVSYDSYNGHKCKTTMATTISSFPISAVTPAWLHISMLPFGAWGDLSNAYHAMWLTICTVRKAGNSSIYISALVKSTLCGFASACISHILLCIYMYVCTYISALVKSTFCGFASTLQPLYEGKFKMIKNECQVIRLNMVCWVFDSNPYIKQCWFIISDILLKAIFNILRILTFSLKGMLLKLSTALQAPS